MRKYIIVGATLAIVAAAAFAILIFTALFAPAPAHSADGRPVWLVTAKVTGPVTIKDPDGDTAVPLLYFRRDDPAYRFDSEDSCKGFLDSDEAELTDAKDGLAAEYPDSAIEFKCRPGK